MRVINVFRVCVCVCKILKTKTERKQLKVKNSTGNFWLEKRVNLIFIFIHILHELCTHLAAVRLGYFQLSLKLQYVKSHH